MSSIGKIFVVVNLVLSLVLLGSLAALLQASRATKDDVARLEQQLADNEAELDQVRSETDTQVRQVTAEKLQLENDNQDLVVAKENADRSGKKLELDNDQLRTDLSKLTASVELLQSDLSAAMQRSKELQDANDQFRSDALTAQEAERKAELARRDLEDQVAAAERRLAEKDGQLTDALARARQAETLVEVAQSAGFNPSSLVAMPSIEAVVAEVDTEYGFVILDKGKADQVERGFTFDVYRQNQYLGQVQVDQVHENHSTARIVLAQSPMRRFDRARTRL